MASTSQAIQSEHEYVARTYHSLPVCFSKGLGARVWDPEGKEYLDFLSAYSAVNQGHCHPVIVEALVEQAKTLALSSRAFYNDKLGAFAEKTCKLFGYETMIPMNSGAEAVESAFKLARAWGYKQKKIPKDKAIILSVSNNFHGRTVGIISMSSDPTARDYFGPYLPLVGPNCAGPDFEIKFNDVANLKSALETHGSLVAAFIVEPIQGEAGVMVPSDTYLQEVQKLCKQHNVLLICDEIQTGIGRTGALLCSQNFNVKPDVVLLGKALSGGAYPISAVLTSKQIMSSLDLGSHGSTFGGNPLAAAVGSAALDVIVKEQLCERAQHLGNILRDTLRAQKPSSVTDVRGMGLLNAIELDESQLNGRTAWDICLLCAKRGVLVKPTHGNIIRIAPPLVILDEDLKKGAQIIIQSIIDIPTIDESEYKFDCDPHGH